MVRKKSDSELTLMDQANRKPAAMDRANGDDEPRAMEE